MSISELWLYLFCEKFSVPRTPPAILSVNLSEKYVNDFKSQEHEFSRIWLQIHESVAKNKERTKNKWVTINAHSDQCLVAIFSE